MLFNLIFCSSSSFIPQFSKMMMTLAEAVRKGIVCIRMNEGAHSGSKFICYSSRWNKFMNPNERHVGRIVYLVMVVRVDWERCEQFCEGYNDELLKNIKALSMWKIIFGILFVETFGGIFVIYGCSCENVFWKFLTKKSLILYKINSKLFRASFVNYVKPKLIFQISIVDPFFTFFLSDIFSNEVFTNFLKFFLHPKILKSSLTK